MRIKLPKPSSDQLKSFLVIFLVSSLILGLFFFKLDSLVGTNAQFEQPSSLGVTSIKDIGTNPLYAPHKLIQFLLIKLGFSSVFAMRSVSALFGFLFVWLYYLVLKLWFTTRIAIFGTLLFATSSWTLHVARIATPDILHYSLIAILAFGTWSSTTLKHKYRIILGILLLCTILYVPSFVLFIAPILIWQSKRIIVFIKSTRWYWNFIFAALTLVLIAPLFWGLINHPTLILAWTGLPSSFPSLSQLIGNIVSIPTQLFVVGVDNPALWLGKSTVLDVFTGIMTIIGGYSYYNKIGQDRARTLLFILLASIAVIGVSGQPTGLTLIFPFIYVLAASGIALMLQQWFTVFPRNPLAKNIGASVITIAVLITVFYHISNYFIAWPNTPETKEVYSTSRH